MKKGFTLIELLIVMVVVTILVTIALPSYKTAMEKGRGLEAMANMQAYMDAANVFYIKNGNSYGSDGGTIMLSFIKGKDRDGIAGTVKSKFFNEPTFIVSSGKVEIRLQRSTKTYTLKYISENGMISSRTCTGLVRYCRALGL